jgi:hypothetical protein
MKTMLRGLCHTSLLAGFASVASAATMTMNGRISDSMCGASHAKMIAAHQGAKMTDKDCTLGCAKAGAKYVFVSQGRIYQIPNQNQSDLMKNAGESVRLTGDVNGDTITVSKVAMMKH